MTVVEPGSGCTHPWLRVTCGVCGTAVDALGEEGQDRAGGAPSEALGDDPPGAQRLFIVARGHPDLVDELRSVLGDRAGVEIIEDRRRQPREAPMPDHVRELRRRLREEEAGGPP